MRLYGTVQTLQFDSSGYTKAMKKALEVQFRHAARAFLRAAIPRVPVQTGMARGSFLNIGRLLNVAVPIQPTLFNQFYYPGRLPKTPATGAALSTPAENVITWKSNQIRFEFQTKVWHYTLEDYFGVRSPSAPWQSFMLGRIAFMEEMRALKDRLPKIKSYMTRTTISFGRGSLITSAPIRLRRQETTHA